MIIVSLLCCGPYALWSNNNVSRRNTEILSPERQLFEVLCLGGNTVHPNEAKHIYKIYEK